MDMYMDIRGYCVKLIEDLYKIELFGFGVHGRKSNMNPYEVTAVKCVAKKEKKRNLKAYYNFLEKLRKFLIFE